MKHFDYVYVSSYSEFDRALVTGLRDAFAASGRTFAVVGYVSRYVERLHREVGIEFVNLRLPGRLIRPPKEAVAEVERWLGVPTRELIFPEAMGYRSRSGKLLRRLVAIHEGYLRFFQGHHVGCLIHKLGAELVRRIAIRHAESIGAVTVFLGNFPAHYPSRLHLHGGLGSERDRVEPPSPNPDRHGQSAFNALLDRIRDRKEVIRYPAPGNRSWREAVRILLSMLRNKEIELLDDIVRRRLVIAQQFYRQLFSVLYGRRQIPEGKFYYFPLHVYDDSQITLRNPQFCDQQWIIEYISRVLPHGMKLVIKFHPGLDGSMSLKFVRALKRLDNVVLLRGSVNSHSVVDKCAGVIVINSTVAYEAILCEKPVFVLGQWSFGRLGLTLHADDLSRLPEALYGLESFRVPSETVRSTLYDLYGEMYDCSFNREPIDYFKLATAITSYERTRRKAD